MVETQESGIRPAAPALLGTLAGALLILVLASVAMPGMARAQAGGGVDVCKSAHAGCLAACDGLEPDDAGRAGCQARCAADRASCMAEAGAGALGDTLDETLGGIDSFLRGLQSDPPAAAGPPSGNGPPSARAPEEEGLTPARCEHLRDECSRACLTRHGRDEAALSGCGSRCAADAALCHAKAKVDEVTPQVQQEVGKWKRFLDGFLSGQGSAGTAPGPYRTPADPDPDAIPEPPPRREIPLDPNAPISEI